MSFCRNCGAEVAENAFICLKCGGLIEKRKNIPPISVNLEGAGLTKHVSFWLFFSGVIVFFVSILFVLMAIYEARVIVYTIYSTSSFHLNNDHMATAFIITVLTLLCVTAAFFTALFVPLKDFDNGEKKYCPRTFSYSLLAFLIGIVIYGLAISIILFD